MKVRKYVAGIAAIAVCMSIVGCSSDQQEQPETTVTICPRTEEFVGNLDCGYYANGVEWVWNETASPAPSESTADEVDIELDGKKKKTKGKITRSKR